MRGFMQNTVGRHQIPQTETGLTFFVLRPSDTGGTQGVSHAHQINDVPTRITLLPFACIRVVEIAIQRKTCDFIVEAQRVVPDTAGIWLRKLAMNARNKFRFR